MQPVFTILSQFYANQLFVMMKANLNTNLSALIMEVAELSSKTIDETCKLIVFTIRLAFVVDILCMLCLDNSRAFLFGNAHWPIAGCKIKAKGRMINKLLTSNVRFLRESQKPRPCRIHPAIREFKKLLRRRQGLRRLKSEFIFYLRISRYS